MKIYHVDCDIFRSITGAEYESEKGLFFRSLAKRNLLCISKECKAIDYMRKDVIHKLKGISSSCGMLMLHRICIKLESYMNFLKIKKVDEVINFIIVNIDRGIS